MATITFTDGKQTKVHASRAIKLLFIQRGKVPGSPEVMEFLKKVESIKFDTEAPDRPKRIQQGRLPYND